MTLQSRTALGSVLSPQITKSTFIQGQPKVQEACSDLVDASKGLAAAEVLVDAAKVALANAETSLTQRVVVYDNCFTVCVARVEQFATSETDITSACFNVFKRESYQLAMPLDIDTSFDVLKGLLRINVKQAPGMHSCITEISTDPSDATKWKRLKGLGARHTLSGYAPGTYWVRAASSTADDESDFTAPKPFVVP